MARAPITVVSVLLPLLLGACSGERFESIPGGKGGASSGPAPVFEERGCPEALQAPKWLGQRCGVLFVPESRSGSSNRQLELQVVLLTPPQPTGEPVVYLPATPGRAGTADGITADTSGALELARSRQLILLDPRGTGLSQPALRCDDFVTCYDNIRDNLGAAPENYSRTEIAADYRDLRQALGLDQWSLLGIGYGSRIALELMAESGQHVRAAVLVSPRPLDVDVVSSEDSAFYRSLLAVTADCTASDRCRERFPQLEATWSSLLARLARSEITGPDGAPVNLRQLQGVLSQWLETDPGSFPAHLEMLGEGEVGAAILAASAQQQTDTSRSTAMGANLAIACSEYVAQVSRADALRDPTPPWGEAATGVDLIAGACSRFPVPSLGVDELAAVASDVPTLIVSGYYDPRSPPSWAERMALSLSRSQRLVFRGLSTRSELDLCAGSVMARFMETPLSPIQSDCRSFEQPTVFFNRGPDGTFSPL